MKLSINLIKNKNEFIANCPELDINCYGETKNEATGRIRKIICFYIESAKELGLDVQNIENISSLTLEGENIKTANLFSQITLSVN